MYKYNKDFVGGISTFKGIICHVRVTIFNCSKYSGSMNKQYTLSVTMNKYN